VFTGTITNTTGNFLQASDLFLNFDAYDLSVISQIDQLLGAPDFSLPDNTFRSGVDLFRVTLQPGALAGIYDIGVTLQDINDNTSDRVLVQVEVQASAIPEPSTLQFCAIAAIALLARRLVRCRHSGSGPALSGQLTYLGGSKSTGGN